MKQMYYITTAILSIIGLILAIYIGNIWMIDQSRSQLISIQIKIDTKNIPPPPDFFEAYAWAKWGGDCDIKRAYFSAKNALAATYRDFNSEFATIFADSIYPPLAVSAWDTTGGELKRRLLPMDELKLFHEPLYNILENPRSVSIDFLKRKLILPKLDKKKYSYLFDFLTENNALQNTCKGWLPFLELYAREEKDSSALNCCKDILAFRPDS